MAVDGFERHRLVVLADDRRGDAAPGELLHRALEVDEGLAEHVVPAEAQVFPADVADDAAPHRVVEVEDKELALQARAVRSADLTSRAAALNTLSVKGAFVTNQDLESRAPSDASIQPWLSSMKTSAAPAERLRQPEHSSARDDRRCPPYPSSADPVPRCRQVGSQLATKTYLQPAAKAA